MSTVREQMDQLRRAAAQEVIKCAEAIDEAEKNRGLARANLTQALRDGLDTGLSVDELAVASGFSTSTVRKFAAVAPTQSFEDGTVRAAPGTKSFDEATP